MTQSSATDPGPATTDPGASRPAPSAPAPGDAARPATLSRPPGERYRARPEAVLDSPRVGRAVGLGMAGVGATMLAMALLYGVLSITAGLIAVAALGGWVIGAGVRQGAWGGRRHRPSPVPTRLAVLLAAIAWVGGLLAAWLVSLALIEGSTRSLAERVTATPFLDWLAPQFGPLEVLELVLLVAVAGYASRSPGIERPTGASGSP